MTLSLNNLQRPTKLKKKQIRRGRGNSSNRGTYSGRGQKGQRSRSGGKGGLKLLGFKINLRQTPKIGGFKSKRERPIIVNLNVLDKNFSTGDKITPQILEKKKIIKQQKGKREDIKIKILGQGEIKKKLIIQNCQISATARQKIVKAGGKVS
ncbi:MAG: 50S ribosomal protein L15 [Candidatus Aenigmarchaeota archaeon]|nr:50S ribosomal protein L15 [Candidatus Aenigmarchaeota archaeon]